MQVWGLSANQIEEVVASVGLCTLNVRPNGRSIALRIVPQSSRALYARRSPDGISPGRKLRATCYHGFRDAINALFAAGATRVTSAAQVGPRGLDVRTAEEFERMLSSLWHMNSGSQMYPVEFGTLCECEVEDGYLFSPVLRETVPA